MKVKTLKKRLDRPRPIASLIISIPEDASMTSNGLRHC